MRLIDIHDDIAARLSPIGLHDALICFGDGQGGISATAYAKSLTDRYTPEQAMQVANMVERALSLALTAPDDTANHSRRSDEPRTP